MEKTKLSERLVSVGLGTFVELKQEILNDLSAKNIPLNNAAISTATVESLIRAVAAMIEENNHSISSDTRQ